MSPCGCTQPQQLTYFLPLTFFRTCSAAPGTLPAMAASGDIEAPLLGDAGSDGVRDAKTPGNEDRTIYVNDPGRTASLRGDTPFVDNVVITSHYTATNFVPKFLVEQFSRFANAVRLTGGSFSQWRCTRALLTEGIDLDSQLCRRHFRCPATP